MKSLKFLITLCFAASLLSTTACSWIPSGAQFKQAAYKAGTAKRTWVPLALGAAWSIDDFDEQTSEWAVENTPVFGSTESADDASFQILDAMMIGALVTSFTLPGENKLEHGTVAFGTMGTTALSTIYLKIWTERERPDYNPLEDDEDDKRSLPSGHSSQAFTVAHILGHNMTYYDMNEQWMTGLDYTYQTMAWGVAWSRVEAQKHWPSDVLAGAALGNFMAVFIQEAWFPESDVSVSVSHEAMGGDLTLNISKPF